MQTEARMSERSLCSVHGKYSKKQGFHQSHHQMGTISNLLAGGIAGAFSKTCTAPLARLTILFQVQGMHSDVATLRKASIWREASRIVYEEGFRAFWKGNLVTVAHRLPYSSISFYSYERYKTILQLLPGLERHKDYASADVCVRLLGGGLSGITAASIMYPLDLVRTRLAAQTNNIYYRGISHALYSICRDEGVRGLYKGLGATLLGVGPSLAISFSVYETLRSRWRLKRPHDSAVTVSLTCGSLSGIASSTVTFPLDLVRRRMQLEGAAGRACVYNSGLLGTFAHIIQYEGIRGLYRGILPEFYKVVPGVGIVFTTFEILKSCFSGSTSMDQWWKISPHSHLLDGYRCVSLRIRLESFNVSLSILHGGKFPRWLSVVCCYSLYALYKEYLNRMLVMRLVFFFSVRLCTFHGVVLQAFYDLLS